MAFLEEPLVSTKDLLFYRRFIEDIFFIWSGNLSDLFSFLQRLNNLVPTIKLTLAISRESVDFLDAIIFIGPLNPGILLTQPFQKPLN